MTTQCETNLSSPFPEFSLHENAEMIYQGNFIKKFHALKECEKKQVIKALEHLSTNGHSVLKTTKIRKFVYGTLVGDFSSRASRKIRFFWRRIRRDDKSSIVLLEIVQRGDSGFCEAW